MVQEFQAMTILWKKRGGESWADGKIMAAIISPSWPLCHWPWQRKHNKNRKFRPKKKVVIMHRSWGMKEQRGVVEEAQK